jgi:rubrerythrin
MLSKETETVLINLGKVEKGLSRAYERLSKREAFSRPVKAFWENLMKEELVHEKVFDDIRERLREDEAFRIEIDLDMNRLQDFVTGTNELLHDASREDLSESEAYTLGARIEAQLDEARFLEKVKTNDEGITKWLKKVENDTKKHRLMLVNYSRGIL